MVEFNLGRFVMTLTALILGVVVHEWAHAVIASRFGDDTPRRQGRLTLWPFVHLEPLGSLVMLFLSAFGFGMGWGRPVETDPKWWEERSRAQRTLVILAGPFANLLLAALFALFYRFHLFPSDDPFQAWMLEIVWTNVVLGLFNLLPIYPMDGARLLRETLPRSTESFWKFNQRFGVLLLLPIVLTPVTGRLLTPIIAATVAVLVGK
jgi:Zn-dependent protease